MSQRGRQSKPLMVYLPDPLMGAVREAARMSELTASAYVRQVLEEHLSRTAGSGGPGQDPVESPIRRIAELERRVDRLEETVRSLASRR